MPRLLFPITYAEREIAIERKRETEELIQLAREWFPQGHKKMPQRVEERDGWGFEHVETSIRRKAGGEETDWRDCEEDGEKFLDVWQWQKGIKGREKISRC